jgi:hypothetical protein
MRVDARSFLVADARLRAAMIDDSHIVHTETWQGLDIAARPEAEMRELLNVSLEVDLRGLEGLPHWRAECRPNLPWADDHFAERVSGEPLNPPPSWAWWPWAGSAAKFRAGQIFNHTYPERYWPKYARRNSFHNHEVNRGVIAPQLGDLNDVVELLRQQPLTRQAYLPIFFPEDTGVGDGGRKPCTLGYQFIVRDNKLHCFYPMRSVDLLRHFRDDVYLTVRLMLWVLDSLRVDATEQDWGQVKPGSLVMQMTSLHCFIADWQLLKNERDEQNQAIADGSQYRAGTRR